jgi:(1->4)-alpha-D-glucan 1-alpha-D-glucosylmutase
MTPSRDTRMTPVSTYRIQLGRSFDFDRAAALAPYLDELGVDACYSSPLLMARPGSPHGYDIVDHNRINPDMGGSAGFARLARALGGRRLGHVLDFVPNHMAADANANPWWRDVLENGPCSRYAEAFDIDWAPLKAEINNRLLLPILGDQYGRVLERGELQLAFEDGAFVIRYFDHRLPVEPRQGAPILQIGLDRLRGELGEADADLRELLSVITGLEHLPPYTSTDADLVEERGREKDVLRARLARLVDASAAVRAHVDRAVQLVNGSPGVASSFDRLHALLEAQPYRLAFWRVAADEINYRRFFDINELAGVRMERPHVFAETHALLRQLVSAGQVSGIRLDHPDGLFDPARYFADLRDLLRPDAPWVIAEKILSGGEHLPSDWSLDGTTGYDFLNDVNGVFIDQRGAGRLRQVYLRVSGRRDTLADVVYASKLLIMATSLASELSVLADSLNRLSEADRRSRDFTLNSLRDLIAETVACFPVYRTYVSPRGWSGTDRAAIDLALGEARRRNPAMEPSSFAFLRSVLLPPGLRALDEPAVAGGAAGDAGATGETTPDFDSRVTFSMKFQQYTAPVQAKGLEDTAFYRYNTLISLNEVGGDPSRFGRRVSDFHAANQARFSNWPTSMTSTSTHDTKLGEDARMRVSVISELSDGWSDAVGAWQRITAGARRKVDGLWVPDGNDVYRLYQVLVGTWPLDRPAGAPVSDRYVERIQHYMIKALREAKRHTSWIAEHQEYESAVTRFIARMLNGPGAKRFVPAFEPFARRAAALGAAYSLGQVLLKLASPGVPDIYQGTEFWTLTLVDPDNRQPVDFGAREQALSSLGPLLTGCDDPATRDELPDLARRVRDLAARWPDGHVKMYVTAAGLRLRRAHRELFLAGHYDPLPTGPASAEHLVAFARTAGDQTVIAVASRLVGAMSPDSPWPASAVAWRSEAIQLPAALAAGEYVDVFTGTSHRPAIGADGQGSLAAADLLGALPVALLWKRPGR